MKSISVNIPAVQPSTYEVRIAPALLADLGKSVRTLAPAPTCGIITDTNVAPFYLGPAADALTAAGYRVIRHIIPAGEQHKTLPTATTALDLFLNAKMGGGGIERSTPIIALGGGVVGDLAGFVAATLLRGVPFIQVPTTLLSAVDASVGGKVGVDHAAGKNLIGAFHQPKLVLTDIATFKTLPIREIRCGLAECIKHAIIRDTSLFEFISTSLHQFLACDLAAMTELVARNVAIKAAIVHEDPFEHGVRALLNFGHTFGHAIENVLNYAGIAHGEAVALGMVAAGRLATALGRFPQSDLDRLITLIRSASFPTSRPDLNLEKTFAAMSTDKKVRAGKLRFILPSRIGQAEVVTGIPDDTVRTALATLHHP